MYVNEERNKGMTIGDGIKAFEQCNVAKNLSEQTVVYYRSCLKYFKQYLDTRNISDISEISTTVIRAFILGYKDNNVKAVTINTYLRGIRAFVNFCVSSGYCSPVKIVLLKNETGPKDTLSNGEVKRLLQYGSDSTAGIIAFTLLATGIRSRTLINLKVKDVDFMSSRLMLRITKNRKPYTLPLTEFLKNKLQKYLLERKAEREEYLFVNGIGQPFTRNRLYIVIKKYLQDLSIDKQGVHIILNNAHQCGYIT